MTNPLTEINQLTEELAEAIAAPGLMAGQIWFPAPGKRAKAREIVRLGDDGHGYRAVFWAAFWADCGHTDISPIRVEGFRKWIRKHGATMKETTNV